MDLRSDDGHGETGGVELACSAVFGQDNNTAVVGSDFVVCARITSSERSVDDSAAAVVAMAGSVCDINECASESEIQDHRNEAQERDAAKTADQQECEDGVQDTSAGDTLNGLDIGVDVQFVVGKDSQEIGKNS